MISIESTNKKQIPLPSWIGVRNIYKKLSEEFQVLTKIFNIDIDLQTKLNLDHLIIAIDEIDTCIDELKTKKDRDSITNSLIAFLLNDKINWNHSKQTPSLSNKVENLKLVVQQINAKDEFIGAAKTIFYYTELKRHTKNVDELIDYLILEGMATAILPLSIMGIKTEEPFGTFFSKLCMLMGIADLIVDARQDFRNGFILLKPNLKLFLNLFKIAVKDGYGLIVSIPKKIQFTKYCVRFSFALILD